MARSRSGILRALFVLLASAEDARAHCGDPNTPIHFMVGVAAGGGNDSVGGLVVQKCQEAAGVTTVSESRVGAGGRIAAEFVAREPADGYTVLVGATGQMSIATAIFP